MATFISTQRQRQSVAYKGAIAYLQRAGAVLRWGSAPRFTCCPPPQIQKLSDRSGVIYEVIKGSKIQIFRAPDPAGETYSAPPDPIADGEGARCSSQEPTLGLVSIGLRV